MNPLEYINKLFCTLFTLCCGQTLYSQIPKEVSLPLEIAELYGLKLCDSYTLSYFVVNERENDYDSFNHGIIEQEKDRKGLKFKKVNDVFFNTSVADNAGLVPITDRFSRIDSIYTELRERKKYEIKIEEKETSYSDIVYKPTLFSKTSQALYRSVNVKEENETIEKQYENIDGDIIKNTVYFAKGKKISEQTENTTKKNKKIINYHYDTNNLVTKIEHYHKSDTDQIPSLIKSLEFEYDDKNLLKRIREGNNLRSYIEYRRKGKVVISWLIDTSNTSYQVEYFLNSDGFISAYKNYIVTTNQYIKRIPNNPNENEVINTEKRLLRSHCIILCK